MIRRVLALLVIVMLAPVAAAQAADGSLVGVRPVDPAQSWAVLRLAPGAVQREEALVVNLSDAPQRVHVGAADATTTADGVFTLAGDAEPRRDVGAWITPDATALDLGPGESRRLGFTVSVPRDAAPGDHAGGLLVSADAPAATRSSGGVAVAIEERVGMRVYVAVPGTRDGRVSLEDAAARPVGAGGPRGLLGLADGLDVSFTVRHPGNIQYARLHGLVELRRGGAVRATAPVDLGTLLPGDVRRARVRLEVPAWSTGDYVVRIRVGAIPEATAEVRGHVGAGRVLGAGGLAVGALMVAGAAALRRVRRAA